MSVRFPDRVEGAALPGLRLGLESAVVPSQHTWTLVFYRPQTPSNVAATVPSGRCVANDTANAIDVTFAANDMAALGRGLWTAELVGTHNVSGLQVRRRISQRIIDGTLTNA